jgi:hypothetical protein
MTLLTGSEYFPGGLFTYDIPMGSGLDLEYGPEANMQLQLATYFDASDQASISRIFGGIHPVADDFPGRRIGSIVGPDAWALALEYFNSSVLEPSSLALLVLGTVAAIPGQRGRRTDRFRQTEFSA